MTLEELKTAIDNVEKSTTIPLFAKRAVKGGLVNKYNADNRSNITLADLGL